MNKTYKTTLLYIEDNKEMRMHICRFLERNGYGVLEAETVQQACTVFQANMIDVVIADLELPGQNGIEFIRFIREMNNPTPVIITSAHSDKEYLLDAINLDVIRYLIKPFKKNDLLDALLIATEKRTHIIHEPFIKLLHGYHYDTINKSIVDPNGAATQFSKKEYQLVELLITQKNQIVPYDTIEAVVWKNTPMSIDALRTLIRGIRKKSYEDIISNINRTGYKLIV